MAKNAPIKYDEFKRRALEIIGEMPPAPHGARIYDHAIQTDVGVLQLSVHFWAKFNKRTGKLNPMKNGWIACRFDDMERAKQDARLYSGHNDRLSPSGKWNWNCFQDEDPDRFFIQFRGALETICGLHNDGPEMCQSCERCKADPVTKLCGECDNEDQN